MSNCPFCNLDAAPESTAQNLVDGKPPTGPLHRVWRGIQWLFPTTVLVLMPKCPLCVAMYVALFTGVGITVTTARWIQTFMLVFCLTSLGCLAVRYWFRRRPRKCSAG
jgi:hypothetical protein